MSKGKRLSNIELLRMLCMFMIVCGHAILYGKPVVNSELNNILIGYFRTVCSVAVDCYILISGYFLIESHFKLSKIVNLWVAVVTYSVGGYVISLVTHNADFSFIVLAKRLLPVSGNVYWFMTVYFGMYMFSPFLNKLIKSLDRVQMKSLIVLCILAFSLWNTVIPFARTWNSEGGNGILWFFCLYIIGAYIRLYVNKTYVPYKYIILFLVCMLTMYIGGLSVEGISTYLGNGKHGGWIINSYTSIIMIIGAVSLFIGFGNIIINNGGAGKFICFISSSCLGVYLIHEQPEIRTILWDKVSSFFNGWYAFPIIIAISVSVFIICIIIEKLRAIIYKNIGLKKLERKCDIVLERLKILINRLNIFED